MEPTGGNGSRGVFRTGYMFALLLMFLLGVAFVAIGAGLFPDRSLLQTLFVGSGIALGPAAVIGALFRLFLFKEVQYQLTSPVIDEIKDKLGPEVRAQVSKMVGEYQEQLDKYRQEIGVLNALKEAGTVHPFRTRQEALKDFASAIDAEVIQIMIIGSSLKGLVQLERYKDIADKLMFKINNSNVSVKFLLTHPAVADLRARQEAREPKDIGREIIETLRLLKKWGVPAADVRLYKGTPTCFAIKTARKMFLNPYPYMSVAFDSPCLIVETSEKYHSYFYGAFDRAHFGAWDTNMAERIYDYDNAIAEFERNLDSYANIAAQIC